MKVLLCTLGLLVTTAVWASHGDRPSRPYDVIDDDAIRPPRKHHGDDVILRPSDHHHNEFHHSHHHHNDDEGLSDRRENQMNTVPPFSGIPGQALSRQQRGPENLYPSPMPRFFSGKGGRENLIPTTIPSQFLRVERGPTPLSRIVPVQQNQGNVYPSLPQSIRSQRGLENLYPTHMPHISRDQRSQENLDPPPQSQMFRFEQGHYNPRPTKFPQSPRVQRGQENLYPTQPSYISRAERNPTGPSLLPQISHGRRVLENLYPTQPSYFFRVERNPARLTTTQLPQIARAQRSRDNMKPVQRPRELYGLDARVPHNTRPSRIPATHLSRVTLQRDIQGGSGYLYPTRLPPPFGMPVQHISPETNSQIQMPDSRVAPDNIPSVPFPDNYISPGKIHTYHRIPESQIPIQTVSPFQNPGAPIFHQHAISPGNLPTIRRIAESHSPFQTYSPPPISGDPFSEQDVQGLRVPGSEPSSQKDATYSRRLSDVISRRLNTLIPAAIEQVDQDLSRRYRPLFTEAEIFPLPGKRNADNPKPLSTEKADPNSDQASSDRKVSIADKKSLADHQDRGTHESNAASLIRRNQEVSDVDSERSIGRMGKREDVEPIGDSDARKKKYTIGINLDIISDIDSKSSKERMGKREDFESVIDSDARKDKGMVGRDLDKISDIDNDGSKERMGKRRESEPIADSDARKNQGINGRDLDRISDIDSEISKERMGKRREFEPIIDSDARKDQDVNWRDLDTISDIDNENSNERMGKRREFEPIAYYSDGHKDQGMVGRDLDTISNIDSKSSKNRMGKRREFEPIADFDARKDQGIGLDTISEIDSKTSKERMGEFEPALDSNARKDKEIIRENEDIRNGLQAILHDYETIRKYQNKKQDIGYPVVQDDYFYDASSDGRRQESKAPFSDQNGGHFIDQDGSRMEKRIALKKLLQRYSELLAGRHGNKDNAMEADVAGDTRGGPYLVELEGVIKPVGTSPATPGDFEGSGDEDPAIAIGGKEFKDEVKAGEEMEDKQNKSKESDTKTEERRRQVILQGHMGRREVPQPKTLDSGVSVHGYDRRIQLGKKDAPRDQPSDTPHQSSDGKEDSSVDPKKPDSDQEKTGHDEVGKKELDSSEDEARNETSRSLDHSTGLDRDGKEKLGFEDELTGSGDGDGDGVQKVQKPVRRDRIPGRKLVVDGDSDVEELVCPDHQYLTGLSSHLAHTGSLLRVRHFNITCSPLPSFVLDSTCQWKGKSSLLQPSNFNCGEQAYIGGTRLSREFFNLDYSMQYRCCQPKLEDDDTIQLTDCQLSGYVNQPLEAFNVTVPEDSILYGVFSNFNAAYMDRQFQFEYCVPYTPGNSD